MRNWIALAGIVAAVIGLNGCSTAGRRYDQGYDGAYNALTEIESARKAGKERVTLDPFWGGVVQAMSDKAEQFYLEQAAEAIRQAVQSRREERAAEPKPDIKPDFKSAPGDQP